MYKRQVETINKVIRVSRQLLQELGHDPTPEEISEEMGMPVQKVREILKIAQEPVSLETPIGEEEDSHLGDFIPDDDAPEPAEVASFTPVSYTHLDVYKRQGRLCPASPIFCAAPCWGAAFHLGGAVLIEKRQSAKAVSYTHLAKTSHSRCARGLTHS